MLTDLGQNGSTMHGRRRISPWKVFTTSTSPAGVTKRAGEGVVKSPSIGRHTEASHFSNNHGCLSESSLGNPGHRNATAFPIAIWVASWERYKWPRAAGTFLLNPMNTSSSPGAHPPQLVLAGSRHTAGHSNKPNRLPSADFCVTPGCAWLGCPNHLDHFKADTLAAVLNSTQQRV